MYYSVLQSLTITHSKKHILYGNPVLIHISIMEKKFHKIISFIVQGTL